MYAAQQIKMVSIIQIQENTEKTPLLTVLTGLKHEKINTNWPPIMTTSPPPLLNNHVTINVEVIKTARKFALTPTIIEIQTFKRLLYFKPQLKAFWTQFWSKSHEILE